MRALLASVPGCIVINEDRHWQYHSLDPETGLRELGSGPASDARAGGFSLDQQAAWQPFLRIQGGFLSVEASAAGAVLRHHDVAGAVVNEVRVAVTR